MHEHFFYPLGDEISISDKDEIVKVILEIDFELGAEGQTSSFRERFTLGQYLLTLASLDLLEYPFAVVKSETPDFVWRREGVEIGLEVTEVTSQRYRRGLSRLRRTSPGELYDPSQFSETALPGGGWAGNANVREWIDLLIFSVLKKVEDYERQAPFSKLELLAYSNTPGGCDIEYGDFPETRNSLLWVLEEQDPNNRIGQVFQAVNVVYGSNLIIDATETPKLLQPPCNIQWCLRNKEIMASQLQAVFGTRHR